jgi:hypothetical protein
MEQQDRWSSRIEIVPRRWQRSTTTSPVVGERSRVGDRACAIR